MTLSSQKLVTVGCTLFFSVYRAGAAVAAPKEERIVSMHNNVYSNYKKNANHYSFLSSTNHIFKDQLPPECRLPTLIGTDIPDLRVVNTIDNEEQIPDLDFKKALQKFDVNIETDDNDNMMPRKHRRTYSENETSKYDLEFGRRKSLGKSLIENLNSFHPPQNKNISRNNKPDGIFDEYIPNFNRFNFSKFGIDENAVIDSEDEEIDPLEKKYAQESATTGDDTDSILSIHQAKPIAIEGAKPKRSTENFEVSNNSFTVAGSPERNGDRQILSSVPKHFVSLSFTDRKQLLNDILPDRLKNDSNYKNHIIKLIRKNSISFSSPSSASSSILFNSFIEKPKQPEADCNEFGSILQEAWKLGRVFNNGAFGIIRECFNIDDANEVRAVKIISIRKSRSCLKNFKSEIIMWSKLKHKYIVPLIDVKITIDNIFLIMPLYNEGSLFDKVKHWENNNVSLDRRCNIILEYVQIITESIKYLHDNGIYHGDIKLENFLLDKNVPLLCDFGMCNYDTGELDNKLFESEKMAEKIQSELTNVSSSLSLKSAKTSSLGLNCNSTKSTTNVANTDTETDLENDSDDIMDIKHHLDKQHDANIGSLAYAAPELLQPCPTKVDRKCDVWALGVLIYTLIALKLPFWHIYEPRLKLMILEGNWKTEEWGKIIQTNENLKLLASIIDGCLVEKNFRFSIDDVKNVFCV